MNGTGRSTRQTDTAGLRELDILPPATGEVVEIMPGLRWTRMPLPMKVGHTNIYLIEDEGGWAVIDAGFGDRRTIQTWQDLLAGPLSDTTITKVIVTHSHIDHIGAAGWLCATVSAPLFMSQVEYLTCQLARLDPGHDERSTNLAFLQSHGVDQDTARDIGRHQARYADGVGSLPDAYVALNADAKLTIGAREFRVLLGSGHSPAQVMLCSAADNLFISADQVLGGIEPLMVMQSNEQTGDPFGLFLQSMAEIEHEIDEASLVLPGHFMPFQGLVGALEKQRRHHLQRCELVIAACRAKPRSVLELVPLLFADRLNTRQLHHAISEIVPYGNWLAGQGRLRWLDPDAALVRRLALVE